jgi:cellulose synthase/poly-beta-1,6-N-acetylglucosamine synthase-like glycosyltransferase
MIVPFLPNPLTVGICAYNEGNNIGKLLQNVLSDQKLSADSEVLVVCSGCTDNTADVVNEFAAKDSRVKAYFEKERNGKASAINYILAKAKRDTILFISADTLPKKDVFKKLTHKLQTPNVGIVSGNPVPVNSTNSLVGRIVQLMWHFHGHVFEELNGAGLARHATEIFCVRRGIVDTMPVETVNDDAFIAVTAKKKGWLIKYSSEAQVSMCGPKTFREYFQQRRRVIFGHYQLRRLTGESPQYLVHMLPLHPVKTVKLVLWLFTRYDPVTLSTFMLTEFLVNTTAIFDFVVRRTHFQWTMLPSTKIVIPQP